MLEYQMKSLLGWAEAGLCSSTLDFTSDKYNAHMNVWLDGYVEVWMDWTFTRKTCLLDIAGQLYITTTMTDTVFHSCVVSSTLARSPLHSLLTPSFIAVGECLS